MRVHESALGLVPVDETGEHDSVAPTHTLLAIRAGGEDIELVLTPQRALWLALGLLDQVRKTATIDAVPR